MLFLPTLPIRTSVSRHRVLSLWRPGGLPAQEQAHLFAVLPGQEPRWRQPHLRRKYATQPEERVRVTSTLITDILASAAAHSCTLAPFNPPSVSSATCLLEARVTGDTWTWAETSRQFTSPCRSRRTPSSTQTSSRLRTSHPTSRTSTKSKVRWIFSVSRIFRTVKNSEPVNTGNETGNCNNLLLSIFMPHKSRISSVTHNRLLTFGLFSLISNN